VFYRGYIANRREILDILNESNSEFPDARIFAAAYRRWGNEIQKRVIGEYSVVIIDELSEQIVLTRDSIGLRPIYYQIFEDGIAFASHVGDLVNRVDAPNLDDKFIADYLVYGQHHESRTVYHGIGTLPCGHTMIWSPRGTRLVRSWSLSEVETVRYRRETDYDERFRELLNEGIDAAFDGTTWAELSGGLDSSTIACWATIKGRRSIEAVSVVYPHSRTADEKEWAEGVISAIAIPAHFVDGDEERAFSEFPDRFVDEPTRTLNNWRLFRRYEQLMLENQVNVLLSGFGGDQVLFGEAANPIYLADWFRRVRIPGMLRELGEWQQSRRARRSTAFMFVESAARPLIRYLRGRSLISDIPGGVPWLQADFVGRMRTDPKRVPSVKPRMETVWKQFFCERIWQISLVAGQLWNQFSPTYELRFPLLYRPLVEFMHSIPIDQQIRPGHDRLLQRRALAGVLPEKTRLRRDKRGPDESMFEGLRMNKEMRARLTHRPQIVERGYVDGSSWKQAVDMASVGHVRAIRSFLSATSLEIWLQQFASRVRG